MSNQLKGLFLSTFLVLAVLAAGTGCGKASHPTSASSAGSVQTFSPPETSFARNLGITQGPVTAEQAKQIAASAMGGSALSVEQEDEDGTQVFGVQVQTSSGIKDVKVRISDGAVTKIEAGGDESGGETGGEGK